MKPGKHSHLRTKDVSVWRAGKDPTVKVSQKYEQMISYTYNLRRYTINKCEVAMGNRPAGYVVTGGSVEAAAGVAATHTEPARRTPRLARGTLQAHI